MREIKTDIVKPLLSGWKNLPGRILLWAILIGCIFTFELPNVHAQDQSLDYQIKAAMLYKFLGYSTWPDSQFKSAHSPYRICVIGSDDIKNELAEIVAQRVIDGRSIDIYSANAIEQVGDAHLVFVSSKMEPMLPTLLPLAKKSSFLIVTENEKGLVGGSTINLRLVDNRIRFDVSLVNAQENGISLSSRLLSIAVSVKGERD